MVNLVASTANCGAIAPMIGAPQVGGSVQLTSVRCVQSPVAGPYFVV